MKFSSPLSNFMNVWFLFWIRNWEYWGENIQLSSSALSIFWKLLCDEDSCSEYTGYIDIATGYIKGIYRIYINRSMTGYTSAGYDEKTGRREENGNTSLAKNDCGFFKSVISFEMFAQQVVFLLSFILYRLFDMQEISKQIFRKKRKIYPSAKFDISVLCRKHRFNENQNCLGLSDICPGCHKQRPWGTFCHVGKF